MTDLSVFSEKDFDPKAYINAACTRKPNDQALDRYLAELEMKLHLGAEDIGLYLHDQSSRAAQRIPVAVRELARIREDAQNVRSSVASTLTKLQVDASNGAAASALGSLEKLDCVKQRMEDACSTLKEAAGLSTLFHLVDDLFASGDLPRVADALAGIRRGLAVVGDSVPEFQGGQQRLERLEDRFAAAAEAPLKAALAGQRGDEAAALAAMLLALGREGMVAKAYFAARSAPLWALWDGYTAGTPFISWVTTFYDQILRSAAAECEWCSASLPERYPDLVLGLLSSFFNAIDKPHRARMAGALTGVPGSLLPLDHLEQAAAAAADFLNGLRQELMAAGAWGSASEDGVPLLLQAAAPVEGAISQYHDKEQQYLSAELPRLMAAAKDPSLPPQALPAALAETVDGAFGAARAALARCVRLTGGSALPALSRVLDRALQQYIAGVQAAVAAMHGRSGSGGGAAQAGEHSHAHSPTGPEAALPLLMVEARMQRCLAECESEIAAAAAAAVPALLAAPSAADVAPDEPLALATLRLTAQPSLRQQLSAYSASVPGKLPSAASEFSDLAARVDALVERALIARVAGHFAAVPGLPEWQARPGSSIQLPSFTPYPLQYITAAGEYLMMLPQLVESALASEGPANEAAGGDEKEEEEAAALVSEWVDRGALAATRLYLDQLRNLRGLSPQGSGQLGADIEYFSNVLSTLGLAVPPALAAWQAALMAPDAAELRSLRELVAGEGGSEAKAAVETVAKLRGVQLGTEKGPGA